jgi:hypothetical protein
VVPGGRSPAVSFADLQAWGYRLAICPGALLWPIVTACDTALGELAANAGIVTGAEADGGMGSDGPEALFRRVGAADWDALRQRFAAVEGGT